ncbi:tRNA pseudouridine(13) synthase TruD [Vibrio sp. 10N.286.49.B3]|uniref:tRNA pseudouridine(13) synthase TruD n=1 Tax=Vibrio sp. 10N.286.49.B3 TaxID=1880855 RepID=UPI000C859A6B|nr:tRNA pseudouridine(13) synthase TruD [Vibrio sp. 10N.286.49.B3]PMH43834.1 tRNA pseudouridine(13) synthase TruD [Vibrio sp. 10N.286.49.B3]
MTDILSPLAYLHGKPTTTAKIKAKAEHFVVKEQLGFSFTGEGEHLMVRIRKTGENTSFVVNELAKACGVKSKDVSWAGLKDRHAVTEQWLSVHLPKAGTPDFSDFLAQHPSVEILATDRHNKKLRPGDLIGNEFEVTLSEVSDVAEVLSRLEKIKTSGVPSYFGAQRFGNEGNNLSEARRWGRDNVRTRNQNKRSLYLSTARSWIFNLILSERIKQDKLTQPMLGDILFHDNNLVAITADNLDAFTQLVKQDQASISIAMAGDNALPTTDEALMLEQVFVDAEPDLMALIRGNRMRHERRNGLLHPQNLAWQSTSDSITLTFSLDSGCFATALVRELVEEIAVEREFSTNQ